MNTPLALYLSLSRRLSKTITQTYSTSFSLGIRLLSKRQRPHIYSIYGFVRLADEIVDSFAGYDQKALLEDFVHHTWQAIDKGISTNPVLHAFQNTYHSYAMEKDLVESFLQSMAMDLDRTQYDRREYEKYILGSAQVVGLMCLHVFLDGNQDEYSRLRPHAMSLGSAFQKVNFLRDLKSDTEMLGRQYFPQLKDQKLGPQVLADIIEEIELDFAHARTGILQLPVSAKVGVFVAYKYYLALLRKIKRSSLDTIQTERLRIPNWQKALITIKAILSIQTLKT